MALAAQSWIQVTTFIYLYIYTCGYYLQVSDIKQK